MLETAHKSEAKSNRNPLGVSRSGVSGPALKVEGKTIADAFLRRIEVSKSHQAYQVKQGGTYQPVVWQQVFSCVLGIYKYYEDKGIKKGARVAILSNTCLEWSLADIATVTSGRVTVPIYPSNSVEDVAFILENSGSELIFTENEEQCRKLLEVFKRLNRTIPIVHFQEVPAMDSLPLISFMQVSAYKENKTTEKAWMTAARSVEPTELASIVYTSGTTGKPKGACLTHANFVTSIQTVVSEIDLSDRDLGLTFLPFAHILGRFESLSPIFAGVTLAFAENINTIAQNIQETSPTFLISVPRIYEKIYAKIIAGVQEKPDFGKQVFHWAIGVGRQVARLRSEKMPIPVVLSVKFKIADSLVFKKIRNKLGGRIRLTASGGAPLSAEICEFFHAVGIKVLEGWGLTETMGPITVNRPDDYRFGTVGKPIRGLELKIAKDGEICVRGPFVFREYFMNPEATKESLTADGWFLTGDIGEIDNRGFLKITDRKKELIVTSAGKNIAPQKLENSLKTRRFVSNCLVYGDKQKYIVAILTLNEEEVKKWAAAENITYASYSDLIQGPQLLSLVNEEVRVANEGLASFETVKKFKILPVDFSIETGELTPSLKLKRKVICEKYAGVIQGMYEK